jgi:hypothetical protein
VSLRVVVASVVIATSSLHVSPARACGPFFAPTLLDDRRATLLGLPDGSSVGGSLGSAVGSREGADDAGSKLGCDVGAGVGGVGTGVVGAADGRGVDGVAEG